MEQKEPARIFIQLNRLPPSLNDYLTMHWRERHTMKKLFEELVHYEWLRQKKFVFTCPVKLVYLLSFPDKQKRYRDKDNYVGGTKPITDALKNTFIFRDDSEWLIDIQVRFKVGTESTIIMIEEAHQ
jgi:Holliday junction resolvase RusA-like endonuclease